MAISFELKHVCKQSGARYGILHTPHGSFETPIFMPVGTQATVKTLNPKEITEVSDGLILANTYHLWLQPGEQIVKNHGGIRGFMKWDGALLTDSGGFQVFSLSALRKISEEGVEFRNPKNGDLLFLTPEKAIQIQEDLGADIIMSFDECPPVDASYDYMKNSVLRTARWAQRGKDAHKTDQALFGIVQGGLNKELRKLSVELTTEIGFPGYSIGGLSVGETKEEMAEMLEFLNPLMPQDKPRYLMGVGAPDDLINGVIHGIDMFDCVYPTRNARHGTAMTTMGSIQIKNKKYEHDLSPLDPNLKSPISKYSKSYLRHLFKADEMLGYRILTYQNLLFLKQLTADIRKAIQEDRLLDFKEEFYKSYYHKKHSAK